MSSKKNLSTCLSWHLTHSFARLELEMHTCPLGREQGVDRASDCEAVTSGSLEHTDSLIECIFPQRHRMCTWANTIRRRHPALQCPSSGVGEQSPVGVGGLLAGRCRGQATRTGPTRDSQAPAGGESMGCLIMAWSHAMISSHGRLPAMLRKSRVGPLALAGSKVDKCTWGSMDAAAPRLTVDSSDWTRL